VGHEYLVANSVFVPTLKPILKSAVSDGPGFGGQKSPFKSRTRQEPSSVSGDPFIGFAVEIILNVIDFIGSSEIAALRLSSRAFTRLPISLWHRLIKDEMPRLYEA
jgi:hypothetical protein